MRRAPLPSHCATWMAPQTQDRANQSNQGERTTVREQALFDSRTRSPRERPRYRSKPGAALDRAYRRLRVERFERAEQLVRRGGEVADARAGCVVDGVDDRRACAADAELAKSIAVERAAVRVGRREKHRLAPAAIGV